MPVPKEYCWSKNEKVYLSKNDLLVLLKKYKGRSFNCVTNGSPYRAAVRSMWKLQKDGGWG